VWHEEEIELTIDDLGLLHESVVHIGTLGWVEDAALVGVLFKESLSDTLVDNDQSDVRKDVALSLRVVLVS
jgi:hypothetical protein